MVYVARKNWIKSKINKKLIQQRHRYLLAREEGEHPHNNKKKTREFRVGE